MSTPYREAPKEPRPSKWDLAKCSVGLHRWVRLDLPEVSVLFAQCTHCKQTDLIL